MCDVPIFSGLDSMLRHHCFALRSIVGIELSQDHYETIAWDGIGYEYLYIYIYVYTDLFIYGDHLNC